MSAEQDVNAVAVRILDREYQIACPPSEQEALIQSARHLDDSMRKIKARGNIHGLEKIAVMAALNITHEMLQYRQELDQGRHEDARRIRHLEDKIDQALQQSRQIEL